MIFPRRFHPCGLKFSLRDDSPPLISSLRIKILFQRLFFPVDFIHVFVINASLRGYFVEWGCIPWGEVIPGRTDCKVQMHSQLRSHPGPGGLQI